MLCALLSALVRAAALHADDREAARHQHEADREAPAEVEAREGKRLGFFFGRGSSFPSVEGDFSAVVAGVPSSFDGDVPVLGVVVVGGGVVVVVVVGFGGSWL